MFGILEQNIPPYLIALCFDLAATNLQTEVFCLTSNNLENQQSDFFALGFLTVAYGPGDIGILYANPSGVDTIST